MSESPSRKLSRVRLPSRWVTGLSLLAWGHFGCEAPRSRSDHEGPVSGLGAGHISAPSAGPKPAAPPTPRVASSDPPALVPEVDDTIAPSYSEVSSRFPLGEIQDVGPAGPMAATERGVYLITRTDGMFLAERKGERFVGIDAPPEAFFRFGRGPALTKTHAYWISSGGNLARAPLGKGSTEYLVPARAGTRAVILADEPPVIAYLQDDGTHLRAMAYSPGSAPVRVSPDGSDVTSLAVAGSGSSPQLVMLEGRSGMSPLHVRTLRIQGSHIHLTPDEVVWVGPGSAPLTEVHVLTQGRNRAMALVPTARDITHFGIAAVSVPLHGGLAETPEWTDFANGIDPAPLSPVQLCGKSYLVYAAPTEERPRSPQELRIAEIRSMGLGPSEVIARSRAYNEISTATLSPAGQGAVLAWTADKRTWATILGCPKSASATKPQEATR